MIGLKSMCVQLQLSGTHRKHRIILDGEMLVWDPVSERNLPFGTLKTAALGTGLVHIPSECTLNLAFRQVQSGGPS